ncbi:hypothetical protein FACS1894124_3830 [Spirochaetia bacterium]|nr:hypothetical protein FACS1894124_3830 [Spirochaetia bacterium]
MNRILFFVHYNKYDGLADYVLYLLEHIKTIYNRIVFISNSPISDEQQDKLAGLYDSILIRENKGYDFGAWKDALLKEGWDNLAQYDSVTLMNDSCFGPIFDLTPIYIDMEQKDIDFWGMTTHQKTKNGMPGTNRTIPEHIQSYFICFNTRVIMSAIFQKFWNTVEYLNDVNKVISLYETQLTNLLVNTGLKYCALYSQLFPPDTENKDIATWHPYLAIQNHVPFVKIKSFVYFSYQKHILNLIKEKTQYPVNLIYSHVTEVFNPNLSLQICDKLIPAVKITEYIVNVSVAIHLHVFYLDVFNEYINYFNTITFNFDLYITTDTQEKEIYIRDYIKNTKTKKALKIILIVENRGRDVLPWLNLADTLSKYDIVGKFHTKKSAIRDEWFGITWQQELFDLLVHPIAAIIETFNSNEKIGIIIPETPYYFCIPAPFDFTEEKDMQPIMNKLWKKMSCKKSIDFRNLMTPIMPCGTMFWYRPQALRSLFDLQLSVNDIPPEPIPNNGTILHCIEHMLVYIAWDEGYDYRIMTTETPSISTFVYNMVLQKERNRIKQSKSYQIGRLLLTLPKAIKKLIDNNFRQI